jgi:hypothetical protein
MNFRVRSDNVRRHACLTLPVSGRRPDEAFHVQSNPHAGGGHEHGFVYARHGRECGGASPL